MDPRMQFFCYLAALVAFALAALGGTRKGTGGQPAVLIPLGLMFWLLPTFWNAAEQAF